MVSGGVSETLQAAPLVVALDRGLPDAHITLLVPPCAIDHAERIVGADAVRGLRHLARRPRALSWLSGWWWLRQRRLDVAVICSNRTSVRLLPFLSGIPRRLGLRHGSVSPLLSDHRTSRPGENRAASWLRLAALLGVEPELHVPQIHTPQEATDRAEHLLLGAGIDPHRMLVGITPGTADADVLVGIAPHRLGWDPERYAHLANQLAQRHGATTVLLGSEADRRAADTALIDIGASHLDLCGQLDLDTTIGVLSFCDLVVTGDSPILHLAAAIGTPSLGLFGPSDGGRRGPLGENHTVVQALPQHRPRRRASLDRIRVEDVLAGIEASH